MGRVCLFFCLSTGRNVVQQVSSAMYVAPDFRPFLNCKMTPLERSAVGRVLSPNPQCCSRDRFEVPSARTQARSAYPISARPGLPGGLGGVGDWAQGYRAWSWPMGGPGFGFHRGVTIVETGE